VFYFSFNVLTLYSQILLLLYNVFTTLCYNAQKERVHIALLKTYVLRTNVPMQLSEVIYIACCTF